MKLRQFRFVVDKAEELEIELPEGWEPLQIRESTRPTETGQRDILVWARPYLMAGGKN